MATEKYLKDANALIAEFEWLQSQVSSTTALEIQEHIQRIKDAPTVDAVEVVRCKDCKHWCDSWVAPDGKHVHGECHMEDADDVIVGRWGDDFCSYGERKSQ